MLNEQVENVMAIAFELARIREEHGAQSGMYLSEVRALRAEVERLAAQAAPTGLTDMGWVIDAARSQAKEGDQHG